MNARAQLLQDRGDLGLDVVVQQQLSATETRHDRYGHVVGRRAQPPLVMIRSTSCRPEIAVAPRCRAPVTADRDMRQFDAQFSSRSAIQGPLRSCTRPVKTSVPVTTMPARALTATTLRRAVSLRIPGLRGQVALHRFRLAGHRAGHTRSPVRLDHHADPGWRGQPPLRRRARTTAITSVQLSPSITVNIESVLFGSPESRTTRTASATISPDALADSQRRDRERDQHGHPMSVPTTSWQHRAMRVLVQRVSSAKRRVGRRRSGRCGPTRRSRPAGVRRRYP